MSDNKYLGSNFDDFLDQEGLLGETKALAIKRVLAYSIENEMKKRHLSKKAMAELMHTSRAALNRLLDPENTSVTLNTMVKAASIIDKNLNITLQ